MLVLSNIVFIFNLKQKVKGNITHLYVYVYVIYK